MSATCTEINCFQSTWEGMLLSDGRQGVRHGVSSHWDSLRRNRLALVEISGLFQVKESSREKLISLSSTLIDSGELLSGSSIVELSSRWKYKLIKNCMSFNHHVGGYCFSKSWINNCFCFLNFIKWTWRQAGEWICNHSDLNEIDEPDTRFSPAWRQGFDIFSSASLYPDVRSKLWTADLFSREDAWIRQKIYQIRQTRRNI